MQAPNTPSIINIRERRDPASAVRSDNAINASTPPSPLLSARITNSTYFSDTTMVMAQNSIEIMPYTAFDEKGIPCSGLKHSFNAYNGLVPMSPNTTPNAAKVTICKRAEVKIPSFVADKLLIYVPFTFKLGRTLSHYQHALTKSNWIKRIFVNLRKLRSPNRRLVISRVSRTIRR